MTRHRYRCDRCARTWPDRPTAAAAALDRARHRAAAHHDQAPSGDQLWMTEEAEGAGLSRPARRMLVGLAVGGAAMAIWNWIHGIGR
jgi:hypothetical protein